MKKIIVVLIMILLVIPININASSYIVMDQNSGRVLNGSNYNESSLIASITKIMTTIIVLENSDLTDEVKVTEEVLKAYGSAIYIEVGEVLTVEDLLYGLMLRSGNDAAIMLAEHVSGSMESFAKLMNDKVDELGLKNTNFVNNHGLEETDGANKSTAYDMAIITKYAMDNSVYRKISGTESITVKSSYKTYSWQNKNRLLFSEEYINGGKTGYTEKAGRTLVTTSSQDNKEIIVVTIRDGNDFENHKTYHENILNNYEAFKVLDKDVTSVKTEEEVLYVKNDYYALVKESEIDNLEIKYEIYDEIISNVAGVAKVYLNDFLLHEEYMYVEEDKGNVFTNFFDKILGWFKSW